MNITREGLPALKRKQKVLGRDNNGLQFRHQLFKRWTVFSQARGKWSPEVTSLSPVLAIRWSHSLLFNSPRGGGLPTEMSGDARCLA